MRAELRARHVFGLCAAAMLLALAGGLFAAVPAQAKVTSVMVGNNQNLVKGGTAGVASGTVSWNAKTNTLTLKNVKLSSLAGTSLSSLSAGAGVGASGSAAGMTPQQMAALANAGIDNATLKRASSGVLPKKLTLAYVYIKAGKNDTVNVRLQGSNSIQVLLGDAVFANCNLTMKGSGSLQLNNVGGRNPLVCGVWANGTLKIAGGTYRVSMYGNALTGKSIRITGGKLATVTSHQNALSSSTSISNKASRLGTIKGVMSKGATFKKNGSTYCVTRGGSAPTAKLMKANPKLKRVKLGTVRYGAKYKVTKAAKGALCKGQVMVR